MDNKPVRGDYENSVDVGLQLGTTWFLGDVGGIRGHGKKGLKDWDFSAAKVYLGLVGGYNFSDLISLRANLGFTKVADNDAKLGTQDVSGRHLRNLSFASNIVEGSLGVQVNFRSITNVYNYGMDEPLRSFSPYFFVGAGLFHFNPYANYNNQKIYLRDLGTEGQGTKEYGTQKYKLTQFYLPYSVGVNYHLSADWNIRFELAFRKTFTDYIDDVSAEYVDPALFNAYLPTDLANFAKALSDRSGERNNGVNIFHKGDSRGNPDKDTYASFTLTLVRNFIGYQSRQRPRAFCN